MNKTTLIITGFIALIVAFLFDSEIIHSITKLQYPVLNETIISLTHFLTIALVLVIIPIIYFSVKKDYKTVLNIVIGVLLCLAITYFIKYLLLRPRPFELLSIAKLTTEYSPSFPSTHATVVFYMFFLLKDKLKKLKIPLLIYAVLVAFSRIFLGMHFTSDVIAGIIIAPIILYLLLLIESKCTKAV